MSGTELPGWRFCYSFLISVSEVSPPQCLDSFWARLARTYPHVLLTSSVVHE